MQAGPLPRRSDGIVAGLDRQGSRGARQL